MNKPATKEPSMDEILSSIRQIIADDDASTTPPPRAIEPPARAAPPPTVPRSAPEPLALSPSQMIPARPAPPPMPAPEPEPAPAVAMDFASMLSGLNDDDDEPMAEMLAGEPELVDPEDIAFEVEPEPEPPPPPQQVAPPPVYRAPEPAPRPVEPPRAPSRPAASVAHAAPMPDPTLSSDMAEQLLAPTTDAAVQSTMSRLSGMASIGIGGQTVEGIMRDILRPMLKDWLDENLPSLVERMVEKEIARISRGVK